MCLPRTFGRAINPLMAATYRSHNHQGRDDNLFVQNHLCRFTVDSHFTPNRGLLCDCGALAVPRLYLLLCHFMPASPPLPAKEHYFLSHSLQFNFLIISKHLFHLWMCLPRTLLMICCDTFCLALQRVFICCVICFGSNSQSVRREWMLHGGVR